MIPDLTRALPAFLLLATTLLVACDVQPSAEAVAPTPTPAVAVADDKDRRPAFPMDEVDAQEMVARIDRAWSNPRYQQSSYDGFSGGHSILLGFDSRSAFIHTRPDGQVWRVRMVEGIAGRCSSVKDPERLISAMAVAVEPSLSAAAIAPVVRTLAKGLSENGIAQATMGRIKLAVRGGCVDMLTATAL